LSLASALRAVEFHEPRHLEPWLRIRGRVIESDRESSEEAVTPATGELATIHRTDAPGCVMVDRSLSQVRESLGRWVESHVGWNVALCELVEADFPSGNEQSMKALTSALVSAPRWLVFLPAPFTA